VIRDTQLQAQIRRWFPEGNQAEAIIANWHFYSEILLSRATNAQLKREAKIVLTLSREMPCTHPDFVEVR
jgi:hypothetical protein